MDLQETIRALEAKGIAVALALGEHQYCELDSNCPLAIQLRRYIGETGITLEQLLEGYQAVTAPDLANYDFPEFDSQVTITVAGKNLSLNLNDVIGAQLRDRVKQKLLDLEIQKEQVKEVGRGLYRTYLSTIYRLKDNHVLPQLGFPLSELLLTGCLSSEVDGNYLFLFPTRYNPQYIVRNGIRYKLSDEDITAIERPVYLEFIITPESKFISATLIHDTGQKFKHYHGRNVDCWGMVTLPRTWNRSLFSLQRLTTSLMNALTTINSNSLVDKEPPFMPHIDALLTRSTELGREGELTQEEEPLETERPATGWGRTGWRTR